MTWRKIAANTIYQLAGKGVGVVSTIITIALVTRALGVSQFGEYVLITTVPAFLYLLADFGLNAVFLRQVAVDNHHVQKFGSLLVLRLGLAALTFLLAVSYAFLSPYAPVVQWGIVLAATTVFAQGAYTSLNALFQHNLRYDLSVAAGIVSSVFAVLVFVWGFWQRAGLTFFVSAWAATTFVLALLALVFSFRLAEKPSFWADRTFARGLFRAAIPLGLMLVFSQINSMADVFLLRALASAEAVGIYRLGYKVFENILPIPIFFVNALYPVMLSDYKQGVSFLWSRLRKSLQVLLAAAVLLTVGGFILAPLVILILGGREFSASTLVVQVLVLSLPIFFVTAPLQWFLITVGKEKVLPAIYGAAAVLNVSINWFLIPRYSYFASIAATIAAEILILLLLLVQTVRFKRGVVMERTR
ncbi:MAG: flippase [candidate division WWE3 bacterium]|nr:flippase [candidate division WWE3 bacterium]